MAADDLSRRSQLADDYSHILTDEYRSRWSLENPGNRAALDERLRMTAQLLGGRVPDHAVRVLDLGCGGQSILPDSLDVGWIVAADLLFDRLAVVAGSGPDCAPINADGTTLPFTDAAFDVVVLSTIISSIPDAAVRRHVANEVRRVLVPGGAVIWYDFRVPSSVNRATKPVGRRELRELFPGFAGQVVSLTVVPPLARRLRRAPARSYALLARLPFLRTHLAACLVKPS